MILDKINMALRETESAGYFECSDVNFGYDGMLRPEVVGFFYEFDGQIDRCKSPNKDASENALDEHEIAIG